jgi:predicted nucleotidyltransferase
MRLSVADRFGLSQNTINKMQGVFAKYPEIQEVVIYGSRANGKFRPGSDIDLTLKGEDIELTTLLKIENEIDELLLPYKVDLSIYDKINSEAVKEHINRVGQNFCL